MTNEEAIKILTEISDYEAEALDLAIEALEQTRPKGKWTQKTGSRALWCSACEDCIPEEIPYAFDYCPNCGAEMVGEEE